MNKTKRKPRAACAAALACAVIAVSAAGCGSHGSAPPAVPSLAQTTSGGPPGGSTAPGSTAAGGTAGNAAGGARATALHAAAQCIRQHGIPGYADPVLTPGGQVYSDSRSFQDASQSVAAAVQQACAALLAAAVLDPGREPAAPPQLVQAGVRAAECLRAHGLPNVTDPTAQSDYTPGHGFGMTGSEMPAGGKQSPVWQHARQACATQLDAEIQASTLTSLGDDG